MWLVKTFREAHNLKLEMRNQEMYLQGLYNYQGFSAVIANFANGFSKHRKPPVSYPDKPIRVTRLSEREKKVEKKRAELTIRQRLEALKKRFDDNSRRKEE